MMTIAYMVVMTTISVTDDVKQKLLRIASKLQIKLGRRVDLNEALLYIISEKERNPHLLDEACKPLTDVEESLNELYAERKLDEERLERKTSPRHKRAD
jgi:hypothetical protein